MADTARQICEQALLRVGFAAPTTFATSTDTTARQIWALLQQVDREIKAARNWQQFRKEYTFTTTATEEQLDFGDAADFPDQDFKSFVNDSMFNRTQQYPLVGPLTPTQWQSRKATVLGDVHYLYTVRGNKLLFMPVPPAGETVAFEYISSLFWENEAGTAKIRPTLDTDVPVLDDELYKLAIVWNWKKAKGLDYAEDMRNYQYMLDDIAGSTEPATTLGLARRQFFLPSPYVPEGGWS